MIKNRITIDGVDKTGKDLLVKYIVHLSNHKYVIQSRGIISQIAYSKIYGRDYEYNLTPYKNDIIFYLTGSIKDLEIRHKITNEPKIDIAKDMIVFNETATELYKKGLKVIKVDTSHHTPYENAKLIVKYLEEIGNE